MTLGLAVIEALVLRTAQQFMGSDEYSFPGSLRRVGSTYGWSIRK
jgi:hypothetical protein